MCALTVAVAIVAAAAAPGAGMLAWTVLAALLAVGGLGLLLWGMAYRQLSYTLADESLEIAWFGRTLAVPYASIEGIYTGQRVVGNAVPKGLTWPGIYVGRGRARELGRLRFFATSPDPSALTVIAGETVAIVVSARDPHAFRTALIERVRSVELSDSGSPHWDEIETVPWSAVRDRWLGASLGLSFLLLLVSLAAIVVGFGALPPEIPMRFDATGQPTAMAPAEDLLRLPLLALIVVLINAALGVWLHPRERLLARLLWVGGAVVLAIVAIAVVRLLQ